jgi:anaerobic selenocysteine-containing dehydrogenase
VLYAEGENWLKANNGKRFSTPSGKIELFTEAMDKRLAELGHASLPKFYTSTENIGRHETLEYGKPVVNRLSAWAAGGQTVGKADFGEKPARKTVRNFPFQLITGNPNALHTNPHTHWAWHNDQATGERYVMIHPDVAKHIKISNGEFVKVETLRGSIEGPALVWDGIQPNTVFVPRTFGDKQVARKDVARGVWDPTDILTLDIIDNLSGDDARNTVACKISSQPGKYSYTITNPLEEAAKPKTSGGTEASEGAKQ